MLEPGFVDGERTAVAEDDGPLDDILQLANIARPAVGLEQIERRFLDMLDLVIEIDDTAASVADPSGPGWTSRFAPSRARE